jgi:DNA repair protein RecO (recombination protein O)
VPTALVTSAIVLRSTLYGESDRIVSLLGRSTGRVGALARGARKSLKRFGGGLGVGATGEACLRERPGADLMTLETFDVVDGGASLGADLGRAAHGGYALELCEKLCGARQPEPEIFEWLYQFLLLLTSTGAKVERLRVFELGLLKRLGIGPSLESCVACGRSDLDDETSRWHPDRGGLVCRQCARHGTLMTADVRRALSRLGGLTLAQGEGEELAKEINAGCRAAVLDVLRVHLTAPLKSLEFIQKIGGSP